jgi:exopolysaccharide biosynthesis protein
MTIEELAVLMTGLGCVEAINLDGGGSTTMVINGRVVNNPSDATGERPISDALLVFPRK